MCRLSRYTRHNHRYSHQLPQMEKCAYPFREAKTVSNFDANSSYWQVEIIKRDHEKIAFTCHHNLYQFVRMRYALNNVPTTFQQAMADTLCYIESQSAFVYLYDIVVISEPIEQHVYDLQPSLTLLRNEEVAHKLAKCSFCCRDHQLLLASLSHFKTLDNRITYQHYTETSRGKNSGGKSIVPCIVWCIPTILLIFSHVGVPPNKKLCKNQPELVRPYFSKKKKQCCAWRTYWRTGLSSPYL